MDTEKIKRLALAVECLRGVKFKVNPESKIVQIDKIEYLSRDLSIELAKDLNAALEPILERYQRELRRELALCSKSRD